MKRSVDQFSGDELLGAVVRWVLEHHFCRGYFSYVLVEIFDSFLPSLRLMRSVSPPRDRYPGAGLGDRISMRRCSAGPDPCRFVE